MQKVAKELLADVKPSIITIKDKINLTCSKDLLYLFDARQMKMHVNLSKKLKEHGQNGKSLFDAWNKFESDSVQGLARAFGENESIKQFHLVLNSCPSVARYTKG